MFGPGQTLQAGQRRGLLASRWVILAVEEESGKKGCRVLSKEARETRWLSKGKTGGVRRTCSNWKLGPGDSAWRYPLCLRHVPRESYPRENRRPCTQTVHDAAVRVLYSHTTTPTRSTVLQHLKTSTGSFGVAKARSISAVQAFPIASGWAAAAKTDGHVARLSP